SGRGAGARSTLPGAKRGTSTTSHSPPTPSGLTYIEVLERAGLARSRSRRRATTCAASNARGPVAIPAAPYLKAGGCPPPRLGFRLWGGPAGGSGRPGAETDPPSASPPILRAMRCKGNATQETATGGIFALCYGHGRHQKSAILLEPDAAGCSKV